MLVDEAQRRERFGTRGSDLLEPAEPVPEEVFVDAGEGADAAARVATLVEEGRIVPGKVMRMTLSVDHRVFYGATAAQFMAEVKRLLENPVTLVVPPTP